MTLLHSVLTVVMLFFLGLVSPGPNFLVVIETTLKSGRTAGLVTGLGAATADAVYASCGLFGVAQFIEVGGQMMMGIQLLGGLYLALLGTRMLTRHAAIHKSLDSCAASGRSTGRHFWLGLVTDLTNPKTVVFFAGIFAVTVHSDSSRTVKGAMLLGIVLTSIVWRFIFSVTFSTPLIRRHYERAEPIA